MQDYSVYFYRLKYSPLMIICCAAVCGASDELRGRGVVDANVCGVADEAVGGYGECGDIRLFFHRFKNTHLLLSASRRTKAVGKDGGYGQRERNVSLLGEVHRRHDGAPSSSGERRQREGHSVSRRFCFILLLII